MDDVRPRPRARPARGERIVSDPYAPAFLSGTSRALLAPLQLAGPLVRTAERAEVVGLAASGLCRHAFIDAHLITALPAVEQVMILGAGYDSRAYRFATEIGARPVYEVDLAPLSRRKAAIVASDSDRFGHAQLHRVEIDFRTQSLAERVAGSGFTPGGATLVVWEGVSMYLTGDAVAATLGALAEICGPGSVLAMDYWHTVGGGGVYGQVRRAGERAIRLIGEPVTFTIAPEHVGALLGTAGFDVVDLAPAAEMTARYASAGRTCDEGMYVVAAQLR